MDEKLQKLRDWVRTSLPEGRGALIPVSGGSDSALAFYLYSATLPERTVGIYFGDHLRAKTWFETTGTMRLLEKPLHGNPEVERWATLLEASIAEHRVLIGTRNRTEDILGTYSAASRLAAHQPLAGLFKSDVLALCEYVGVPQEIIDSSKEADPECGRPEELARIPFEAADLFAKEKIGLVAPQTAPLDDAQRAYLEALYIRNHFKKELPLLGPEV
jgi:NH3-dependent NAD+ synthetase